MTWVFFVVVCCGDAKNPRGDIIDGFDGFENPVLEIWIVPTFSPCVNMYVTVFVDVTGSSSLTNSRARPASILAGG